MFPTVSIAGKALTDGQVMTLGCALNNFAVDLRTHGLGDDEDGRQMVEDYLANIRDIQSLLLENVPRNPKE